MKKDNVVSYKDPSLWKIEDSLTEFLKSSAQKMLQVAIETEVDEFISRHTAKQLANGQRRIVRNGYMPTRSIQTGIGSVSLQQARVRDKGEQDREKVEFSSTLVPKYMRRSATLDVFFAIIIFERHIHRRICLRFRTAVRGASPDNLTWGDQSIKIWLA